EHGLILIDPVMSAETARAALDLYYRYRPHKPVAAVFYNHSHIDHFGGIKGIVSEEDVASGKVQIIAPDGFMEHVISENVLAGNAMSRRTEFQFGPKLPRAERGQVDIGGAKQLSNGTFTLIPPTRVLTDALTRLTIDGVDITVMLANG